MNRFAYAAAAVIALNACARNPPKPLPVLTPAPKLEVYKLSDKARQSRLVAFVFDVPIGTTVGTDAWGFGGGRCTRSEPYVSAKGRITLEYKKYTDLFVAAMKARGYSVEDESEMFRDTTDRVADLQVAGRIVEATLNECQPRRDQNLD